MTVVNESEGAAGEVGGEVEQQLKKKKEVKFTPETVGEGEVRSFPPVPNPMAARAAAAVMNAMNQIGLGNPALLHFSYSCPGLHGPESKNDVAPFSFAELFAPDRMRYVIPLIQRPYCWEKQIAGWWRDVAHGHRTGKIVLRPTPDAVDVIDGQQRITTCLLLIAAIKDAVKRCHEDPTFDREQLLRRLDKVLFRDAPACTQPTLIPSLLDRAPFFDLIGAKSVPSVSLAPIERPPETTFMGRAKAYFAERMGGMELRALESLAAKALGMTVMRVAILNPIHLGQVFLWLQEKSLVSMGALLWNPSPGENFLACDLVRNMLLAPFLSLPMDEQEKIYREVWFDPIEAVLPTRAELDVEVTRYVMENKVPMLSNFEQAIAASAPIFGEEKLMGIRTYSKAVSIFESMLNGDDSQENRRTCAFDFSKRLSHDLLARPQRGESKSQEEEGSDNHSEALDESY